MSNNSMINKTREYILTAPAQVPWKDLMNAVLKVDNKASFIRNEGSDVVRLTLSDPTKALQAISAYASAIKAVHLQLQNLVAAERASTETRDWMKPVPCPVCVIVKQEDARNAHFQGTLAFTMPVLEYHFKKWSSQWEVLAADIIQRILNGEEAADVPTHWMKVTHSSRASEESLGLNVMRSNVQNKVMTTTGILIGKKRLSLRALAEERAIFLCVRQMIARTINIDWGSKQRESMMEAELQELQSRLKKVDLQWSLRSTGWRIWASSMQARGFCLDVGPDEIIQPSVEDDLVLIEQLWPGTILGKPATPERPVIARF